ncbi:hypothetical protein [Nocardia fluminea]|uniref:hypothetical protein n=1 Tax=Nocardia fluminea TaxID=134984 RepID=UPI00364AC8FE
MIRTDTRQPAVDDGAVIDCAACDTVDGMRHTHDLTDDLERTSGEVWTCTECGAEYIDEW